MARHASPYAQPSRDPLIDSLAAIQQHIRQICVLAEEYVSDTSGAYSEHPARVAWHEQQLHKLGVNRTSIYSFVNRARTYTRR